MLTDKQRKFVLDLDKHCKSHEDWRTLVAFGMPTLIAEPELLIDLLVREAEREARRTGAEGCSVELMAQFLDELGLRFVVAGPREGEGDAN